MRLNGSQLQFLARFAKSPDGREVVELLRAMLTEVEGKLRTAAGEELYRQQGRAVQLDELLADIEEANQRLNLNLSAQRPRQVKIQDGSVTVAAGY